MTLIKPPRRLYHRFFHGPVHDTLMWIAPASLKRRLLSCKEVAHRLKDPRGTRRMERFFLNLHVLICEPCTHYREEMRITGATVREFYRKKAPTPQRVQASENAMLKDLSPESSKD